MSSQSIRSTLEPPSQSIGAQASAGAAGSAAGDARAARGVTPRLFYQLLAALLILSAVSFASISYTRPKFNRSEIAYAEIAREMIDSNSYIVPVYRGVSCLDKPVLNYWVLISSFKAFGQSGFTARIPALLASLACLALLAVALEKAIGWQASLFSTAILASAQRYWEFSTLCMTDMFLTLFDCASLILLYIGLKQPKRRLLAFSGAAASMGLAVLTKGPVGMILPALLFFIYLVVTRQFKILSFKQVAISALVLLAVAAPWYVAAGISLGSVNAVAAWLWQQNLERFSGSSFAWHYSPFYMVGSLFSGFAPWSLFLPFAFVSFVRSFRTQKDTALWRLELYLWMWIGLTTTFFTLSRGKMNYYDLPCFPAAATIVGLHIVEWIENRQPLGTAGAWLMTAIIFGGAAAAVYLLPNITEAKSAAGWIMMPSVLFASGLFCLWSLIKRKPLAAYGGIFAALLLTLFSFSCQVAPAMAKQAPALSYFKIIEEFPASTTRQALHMDFATTIDWFDCTLFETHRSFDWLAGDQDLIDYLNKPGEALVILPKTRFDRLPEPVKARTRVVASRPYMYEKIDLKFLATRHGKLTGAVPLLLILNQR